MTVRCAREEDVTALVGMGERYCRDVRQQEPDAEAIAAHVRALMSSPKAAVFVAEKDGKAVGTAMYIVHPDPLTAEIVCLKVHLYVLPEYRGVGIGLMREGERWAVAQDAKEMIGSASDERAANLMRATGYEALETKFRKRLNGH